MHATDIRDQPTPAFIGALREQFRFEPEIDRLLTRKMERRSGPPYRMVTLEQLTAGLQSLLESQLAAPFEIREQRWLAGGASKLQMRFALR